MKLHAVVWNVGWANLPQHGLAEKGVRAVVGSDGKIHVERRNTGAKWIEPERMFGKKVTREDGRIEWVGLHKGAPARGEEEFRPNPKAKPGNVTWRGLQIMAPVEWAKQSGIVHHFGPKSVFWKGVTREILDESLAFLRTLRVDRPNKRVGLLPLFITAKPEDLERAQGVADWLVWLAEAADRELRFIGDEVEEKPEPEREWAPGPAYYIPRRMIEGPMKQYVEIATVYHPKIKKGAKLVRVVRRRERVNKEIAEAIQWLRDHEMMPEPYEPLETGGDVATDDSAVRVMRTGRSIMSVRSDTRVCFGSAPGESVVDAASPKEVVYSIS